MGGGLPSNSHTILLHGPCTTAKLTWIWWPQERENAIFTVAGQLGRLGLDLVPMKTVLLISHQNHSVVPDVAVRTTATRKKPESGEVLLEEKNGGEHCNYS